MEELRLGRFRISLLLALCILAGLPFPARAQDSEERITSYHSDITVNTDATVLVRETIQVATPLRQIPPRLERDLPTRYADRMGNPFAAEFRILSMDRDGKPEDYHIERKINSLLVHIGSKNEFLAPGTSTYTIRYETNRQIGFFPDRDELYWNVTANGWSLPIEEASAEVHLPSGIVPQAVLLDGYTGRPGTAGTDFKSSVGPDGVANFMTSRRLAPHESLTIVVSWPKGFVAPPTTFQKAGYFIHDNLSTLIAILGLILLFVYYTTAWKVAGRGDERKSAIASRAPPEEFSPAEARFVERRGFDNRLFAVVLIDMAMKGCISIEEKDGIYAIARGKGAASILPPEARIAAEALFAGTHRVALKAANSASIRAALNSAHDTLYLNIKKTRIRAQLAFLIPGFALSALTLLCAMGSFPAGNQGLNIFVGFCLSALSFGAFALAATTVPVWKRAIAGVPSGQLSEAFHASTGALVVCGLGIAAFLLLGYFASTTLALLLLSIVLVNWLFYQLLNSPSHAGRRIASRIEELKVFLSSASEDDMKVQSLPQKTPHLFEKYLPYALALNLERVWEHQFQETFANMDREGRAYSPGWYTSGNWRALGAGGLATSLTTALASAVSGSSRPAAPSPGKEEDSAPGEKGKGG